MISELFQHCFDAPGEEVKQKDEQFFNSKGALWVGLLAITQDHLCNCFYDQRQPNYEEVLSYMNHQRVEKEISDLKFDPRDYFLFTSQIMEKLCAEARDPLLKEIDGQIGAVKRFSEFDGQAYDPQRFAEYCHELKKTVEKLIYSLVLMQCDISCFDFSTASRAMNAGGDKRRVLIQSEQIYFDKIIQMSKFLRRDPLETRQSHYLPMTTRWLQRNQGNVARAWAELVVFEAIELPEVAVSSQEDVVFLGSLLNNFVIVSSMSTLLESLFRDHGVPYDHQRQSEVMKSVRLVMMTSETNCMLFEMDKVVSTYYDTFREALGERAPTKEELLGKVKTVCDPRGSLYKLSSNSQRE